MFRTRAGKTTKWMAVIAAALVPSVALLACGGQFTVDRKGATISFTNKSNGVYTEQFVSFDVLDRSWGINELFTGHSMDDLRGALQKPTTTLRVAGGKSVTLVRDGNTLRVDQPGSPTVTWNETFTRLEIAQGSKGHLIELSNFRSAEEYRDIAALQAVGVLVSAALPDLAAQAQKNPSLVVWVLIIAGAAVLMYVILSGATSGFCCTTRAGVHCAGANTPGSCGNPSSTGCVWVQNGTVADCSAAVAAVNGNGGTSGN